ncbi:MAG: thiolase family protein [Desulfobacterales bacterium]|nr:MAG: thiolase family protein [Desulfobacterales bacterium]
MLTKAYIPYKGYFSSPFSRWQGSMANENSIVLAAETSKRWLAEKNWDPKIFDYLFLGITIHQPHGFYGGPWAAALIGATGIPGLTVSQACSTSTICLYQASVGVETGLYQTPYCLMTDRCSNGPHVIWPNPMGPGAQVNSEDWLMDNFNLDPWGGTAMIQTAENVAKEHGITRDQVDAVTLRRYEQYKGALVDDRAFQKRYMYPVMINVSKKKTIMLEEDEGVIETTAEGLAKLKPVLPGGTTSFGAQTHPADGHCAVTVTTRDKAKELSADPDVEIQVLSYGYARTKPAHMAAAVYPAVQMALDNANIAVADVKAIKTHNPFAANDVFLADKLNYDVNKMNNYGCSLIYGHPQGPTAGRLIIEGIEEVVMAGGGYMLFGGCAAGDTAAAIVMKIG